MIPSPFRVLVAGGGRVRGAEPLETPGVDAGRLRRMDRFGRVGFVAGTRALLDAGYRRLDEADPETGVVFGSAFGCRDSITDHARLVAERVPIEELRPALFAQTVHNTVNGELAIHWNLGGISETLLGARTSGLDALLMAADRIGAGAARRAVAGGAEGLHQRMREAAAGLQTEESGAALVLEAAGLERHGVELAGGASFFEPDPRAAAARLASSLRGEGLLVLAHPAADSAWDALRPEGWRVLPPPAVERFGAAGPFAALDLLERLANGEAAQGAAVVRDPEGPTALVLFRITPRNG